MILHINLTGILLSTGTCLATIFMQRINLIVRKVSAKHAVNNNGQRKNAGTKDKDEKELTLLYNTPTKMKQFIRFISFRISDL